MPGVPTSLRICRDECIAPPLCLCGGCVHYRVFWFSWGWAYRCDLGASRARSQIFDSSEALSAGLWVCFRSITRQGPAVQMPMTELAESTKRS